MLVSLLIDLRSAQCPLVIAPYKNTSLFEILRNQQEFSLSGIIPQHLKK